MIQHGTIILLPYSLLSKDKGSYYKPSIKTNINFCLIFKASFKFNRLFVITQTVLIIIIQSHRLRVEHMERQLANLTGLVQKALTQTPTPRDFLAPPGRDAYRSGKSK